MIKVSTRFQKDFDCEYAIPVGSGTTGIFLILKAISAQNKKIILPAFTCPNVAVAVYAAKAIPVVVDISYADANIDSGAVHNAIDEDVAAILAVDTFGYPASIPNIEKATGSHNCVVIEDACQAYGGMVDKTAVGSRGLAGVISFGYSKPLALGGGGMILTNDASIAGLIEEEIQKANYRCLVRAKNKLALNLMFRSKNCLLKELSRLGLYQFQFPEAILSKVLGQWSRFKNAIPEVKSAIFGIADILNDFNGTELFEYENRGWLPWRYSFRILDPEIRMRFTRMCQNLNIPISNLYRPIAYHFKDVDVFGSLENTNSISRCVLNLKYSVDLGSVQDLMERVERLREKW